MRNKVLPFSDLLELLTSYVEKYGDCRVPFRYVTEDGIKLGFIVQCIRCGTRKTSEDEKAKLDEIGFIWNRRCITSFKEVFYLLILYKKENGNLNVPVRYVTDDGIKLGYIVENIRTGKRKISDEEKKLLELIGFTWKVRGT